MRNRRSLFDSLVIRMCFAVSSMRRFPFVSRRSPFLPLDSFVCRSPRVFFCCSFCLRAGGTSSMGTCAPVCAARGCLCVCVGTVAARVCAIEKCSDVNFESEIRRHFLNSSSSFLFAARVRFRSNGGRGTKRCPENAERRRIEGST